MAKYGVRIVEKLARTFIVEADTYEEAVQKTHDTYISGNIILDSDDYEEVEFEESATFGKNEIPKDSKQLDLFTALDI